MTGVVIGHGGDLATPSGGTDRVSAIAAGLDSRGISVSVVAPDPSGSVPSRLDGIELIGTVDSDTSAPRRAIAVTRRAQQVAQNRGMALQLEHSSLAGFGTLQGHSGYILDMHDLAFPRYELTNGLASPVLYRGVKWLESRAVSQASHIIVVSEAMQSLLVDHWDVPAERMTVVPNGYFPETVSQHSETPVEPGRVVFLGTLHPKVDVEALVEIAELPAVSELYVIGDGAKYDELRTRAANQPALTVTGRLPDSEAFELVASGAVLVNPQTVSELQRSSSPVKLYYYAALGKPIVATPGPSVVSQLVAGDAALAAETRTAFVDSVERVLGDEQLAARLSENAASLADSFQWDRRVDSVERVVRAETDEQEATM